MRATRKTIRFRLTVGFIAVVLVANTLLSLLTITHISSVLLEEVQTRVRLDLNSARNVYEDHARGISRTLATLRLSCGITNVLISGETSSVGDLLNFARAEHNMDMLTLLDRHGKVLYRSSNRDQRGDELSTNPIVAEAIRSQAAAVGTIIVSREDLLLESRKLAQRAYAEILPTPAAHPSDRQVETSGMVVGAAVPVVSANAGLVGFLYGANLLNRRYGLVDTIKEEVFPNQTIEGHDIGSATIFQNDLRISTNVLSSGGERAVGTRLSAEVFDAVVTNGETWADRAFVVHDWYITAYEPIRNPAGKIIGALYVGLLEAPFTRPIWLIVTVFLSLMALTTVISLVLFFFMSKSILNPIGKVLSLSHKMVAGDLSARVGIRPPGEMGLLCEAIDQMADAVEEREEQLKDTTRRQIGQSEKLASVGRLAAGIAHEINNPLTGVLTFSHLLRKKDNLDEQDRQDVELIIHETTRVREIVRGLLDFARETPSSRLPLNLNEVIRQTIKLVQGQKDFGRVKVNLDLSPEVPEICADANQLQQVLLNLALNACEAMPKGGTLTIRTRPGDDTVEILVRDTGVGIRQEVLDKVFEPFFTTKEPGKGTGLGLAVSYGIVQQHGGTMHLESTEGAGTFLTIVLPTKGFCTDQDTTHDSRPEGLE
jgi:two-component system, NtrC family, sensor kinase